MLKAQWAALTGHPSLSGGPPFFGAEGYSLIFASFLSKLLLFLHIMKDFRKHRSIIESVCKSITLFMGTPILAAWSMICVTRNLSKSNKKKKMAFKLHVSIIFVRLTN